jgi:hypothetical protein
MILRFINSFFILEFLNVSHEPHSFLYDPLQSCVKCRFHILLTPAHQNFARMWQHTPLLQ